MLLRSYYTVALFLIGDMCWGRVEAYQKGRDLPIGRQRTSTFESSAPSQNDRKYASDSVLGRSRVKRQQTFSLTADSNPGIYIIDGNQIGLRVNFTQDVDPAVVISTLGIILGISNAANVTIVEFEVYKGGNFSERINATSIVPVPPDPTPTSTTPNATDNPPTMEVTEQSAVTSFTAMRTEGTTESEVSSASGESTAPIVQTTAMPTTGLTSPVSPDPTVPPDPTTVNATDNPPTMEFTEGAAVTSITVMRTEDTSESEDSSASGDAMPTTVLTEDFTTDAPTSHDNFTPDDTTLETLSTAIPAVMPVNGSTVNPSAGTSVDTTTLGGSTLPTSGDISSPSSDGTVIEESTSAVTPSVPPGSDTVTMSLVFSSTTKQDESISTTARQQPTHQATIGQPSPQASAGTTEMHVSSTTPVDATLGERGPSEGVIVGAVVGSLLGLVALLFVIFWLIPYTIRRHRRNSMYQLAGEVFHKFGHEVAK